MRNITSITAISALLLCGCEKVVNLKYKSNQSRIVIEGNITNEAGPCTVRVSRSVKLAETGSYPTVDDATVTISDNAGNSATLTAMGNGEYSTTTLTGMPGRTYTLTVLADNATYTAQSTLPLPVPFDSVKVETVAFAGEPEYNLIPVFTDPAAAGNNYRFLLRVNGRIHNQQFVQNDDMRNGMVNTFRLEINGDNMELKKNDTVEVAMQCIDAGVGMYYKTLALIADSGPGGGTTPNNPPSNISNGALGVFSAHTVQVQQRVIR